MAVTRINNNQITDASAGNAYLGIDGSTKLQNYSVTAGKLANSLVYGSDLTVSGNLTVNGTSTAIDTTITTIEDPVIVLASTQTGSPTVDIGFLGERGTANNIAFVWNEANSEFVTAFTNTSETNTTISIIGYANLHTNNMVVDGTTSLVGNIIGTANFSGNVNAGNLNAVGTVSAASTVGGVITGSSASVTGIVTAASVVGGVITGTSTSVTGTQTAASTVGGVITGSSASVTGNVNGGNILTTGLVSSTGNITADPSSFFIGNGSQLTGVTASSANAETLSGTFLANNVVGSSLTSVGVLTSLSVSGNTISGNLSTGGAVSATGNITGANFATTGSSGNITGANNIVGTTVSGTANVIGGNVLTGGYVSATGDITGGNVLTGGNVSATGNVNAGNTNSNVYGTTVSASGTVTAASVVGGAITGSSVSVTGNVTGGNLVSATVTNPTAMTISTNAGNINLEPTGNIVVNNTYINGLQLTPVQDGDAASKYYVDTIATTGITIHESVYAATNTTLATATGGTISYTQPNGVSNGIGAYIQTTGTFTTIDTANVQTAGTRILVKNEANATYNGVYTYSNATAIVRSTDTDQYGADAANAFSINDYFFTTNGNVNAGTAFVVSAPAGTITFGTSNIAFAVFSQSQVYTANTSAGLVLNGTVFSAKVDENTTSFDGLGNIIVKAGANLTTPNIGAATGTSLSVTGTVTAASTVGGVITGSSASVSGTVTAASTVGGVITGSSVSVTGNVDAGNTNSNVYGTTVSASGTVTAASTVGGVITGSSASVTGTVTASSVVGGVITGTSTSVTGTQTAASTVGGVITGSSASVTGDVTGGNILTSGNVSATGNVIASWLIGNIQGSVNAPGANTQVIFNDGGVSNATSGFTFDKTSNLVTIGGNVNATNFNGNVYGTSVSASGTVTAASTVGGVITGSSASVTGIVTAASVVGGVITGSSVSVTGDVSGSNLSISGGNIDSSAAAITVNGTSADVNFAVNGDTTTVFFVDAGTGTASFGSATQTTNAIVAFNSTNSILTPVGNTAQRPATGVTGMLRFNSTDNNLELFDNSQWSAVGVPSFTVIADEQFNGDGVNVAFTLSSTQTTNSCIVSINGVVQIPTIAYSVAGTDPTCVLTFTEAPETGDIIDVREITTTTTVTSLSNSSGNAVIATSATTGNVNITGNVMPTANATANIGSASSSFNTIFAQATSAQYADLAEKYVADAEYAPGTVVVFGGTHEVTVNATDADRKVAGVVSTNPSYTMNGGLEAEHVATVALTGRVPTMVVGTVRKGDLMVAAGLGRARAEADPKVGTVIGKALEDFDGAEGTIEVVVGRF